MDIVNRGVIRGQITKLVKNALEYLGSSESQVSSANVENCDVIAEELSAFLLRISVSAENLRKANESVRATVKSEDLEKECESVVDYEDKIANCTSRLNSRLLRVQGVKDKANSFTYKSGEKEKTHSAKLPKLDMKRFSGDFKDWLPFWEQFKTLIHENSSLTASEKFNYLQSALCGKAAASIAGYPATQACYDAAIASLQEEYGDVEKLVDKHLQNLMALQPVNSRHDIGGIRQLYNTVVTHTRTLTALGVSSSKYYVMLKAILLKCLPNEMRIEYYKICSESDKSLKDNVDNVGDADSVCSAATSSYLSFDMDQSVKDLLKYIKREVESVERAGVTKITKDSGGKMIKTAAGLLLPSSNKRVCFFCNSEDHYADRCNDKRSVSERKEMLKGAGRCFKCTRKGHNSKHCLVRNLRCMRCHGRHASSLCDPDFLAQSRHKSATKAALTTNLCSSNLFFSNIYLQTATVYASKPSKVLDCSMLIRLVLDGGSQRTYIKENVATKLNLPTLDTIKMRILPFGSSRTTSAQSLKRVKVTLRSTLDDELVTVIAVVVPEICLDTLPIPDVSKQSIGRYSHVLADSNRYKMSEDGLSLLIGADYFWKIVSGEFERINDRLVAIKTCFGWTLHGPETEKSLEDEVSSIVMFVSQEDNLNEELQRMWSLEEIGIKGCEDSKDLVDGNWIKKVGNRYEASLLWKDKSLLRNNNREESLRRIRSLVRKLARDPDKLVEYDTAMREMIAGFAEISPKDVTIADKAYYMPHRPVYRYDKTTTKVRIVFDASSRERGQHSLNDCLSAGPNLLPNILSILLRFRSGLVAMTSDIEKAFLQIDLASEDRDFHRFIWFKNPLQEVNVADLSSYQEYRMKRLTFGVKCSPYLLQAAIQKLLQDCDERFSNTRAILQKSFYMDDLVFSVNHCEEARRVYTESCQLLEGASMNMRKWNTNDSILRSNLFSKCDLPVKQKVLGIVWYTVTDELALDLEQCRDLMANIFNKVTKRRILQLIARMYDPLGMLTPFVIKLKVLFQTLWKIKLPWDSDLPSDLVGVWRECCADIHCLTSMTVPRCIIVSPQPNIQLHIFADASPVAYGAVAYVRSESNDSVNLRFLCSKGRVAPLKEEGKDQLSLPKLELTAALVASRLRKYATDILDIEWNQIYLWTDSKIVLHWIINTDGRWKPYVHRRVAEIRENSVSEEWRHCPGQHNPADLLTRGVSAKSMARTNVWLKGPSWLLEEYDNWPQSTVAEYSCEQTSLLSIGTEEGDDGNREAVIEIEKFSSRMRLLRVTSYVKRFVDRTHQKSTFVSTVISAQEIEASLSWWIRLTQSKYFQSEIKAIKNGNSLPPHSMISGLNPILDNEGFLRVGSRLLRLYDSNISASPLIISRSSYFAKLIVLDYHSRTLHGGVNMVLSRIREKFWIPRGRQFIKEIVRKCVVCQRLLRKPANQPFAPLPRSRMIASRPFQTTGIDFAGPLFVKENEKSSETRKVYIMLLTCATVRAIHLELVADLTTESCLRGLRRFIARRGAPDKVISDNARTFKRASKEFSALGKIIFNEEVQEFVAKHSIKWEFIVERAPWWGGFWERMVRSIKTILRSTIGRAILTIDEMQTLLSEAEAIINDRPLTYISDDPLDLNPLKPSHFLLVAVSSQERNQILVDELTGGELRQLWTQRLKITNLLWKRWKSEYLQLLRSVHNWKKSSSEDCIQEGDIVLVNDVSKPRVLWKLAMVERTFPGRDGKVRSCEVRFHNGTRMRRPIQLLYPLEIPKDN